MFFVLLLFYYQAFRSPPFLVSSYSVTGLAHYYFTASALPSSARGHRLAPIPMRKVLQERPLLESHVSFIFQYPFSL